MKEQLEKIRQEALGALESVKDAGELDALLKDIRPLVERLPAGVLRAVATQRILEGIPCGIISRRMHFSRCYVYRLLDQACDRLCQMEEARLGLKKNEK